MKTWAKLVGVLVLLLGLAISMASAAAPPQAKYTLYALGVTPGADPFWAVVYNGIKAADDLFPVEVNYVGVTAEEANPIGMANKLDTVIAAKPDGIITGFWFVEAEDEVCRKAIEEGIPILAYDMEDIRPKNERIPYLGFVGLDIRVAGEALARGTLEKINIKRAAIGIHWPGASSLELKASGIVKVLEEEGIPYDKLDITDNPSTAASVFGAYLTKYPETNVLFSTGTLGTHPALTLIKEKGLEGKVFLSAMDISEKTLQGIKDGIIIQTITHQPFALAFMAVEQLYLYLEYGIIPPERTSTGPTLIDQTNVEVIEKQIEKAGGA